MLVGSDESATLVLVSALGDVIASRFADWPGSRLLEVELFGTTDGEEVACVVDRFCADRLGSPIERYEFFATSVFSVHGVQLRDGRGVVVKVARRSVGEAHLDAVQAVQAHLAEGGFPCPRPLLGPISLKRGIAVAEELLDRGARADAHEPAVRRAIAFTLARQIDLRRDLVELEGLGPSLLASPGEDELWPEPHDARFDFIETAEGAEWIDELAAAARARLADSPTGETVVAHSDWRAEHLRFAESEIVASYDWQSLAVGGEGALIGQIGHAFTADWGIPQTRRTPTLEECRAFVADYEAARGRPFESGERTAIDAAWVYATAYGARCQHSDLVLGMPWADRYAREDSYQTLLARASRP